MSAGMFMDALKYNSAGIKVRFRLDGNLFNFRRLRPRSKIHVETISELPFPDNLSLRSKSEDEMQPNVEPFTAACMNYSLTI